MVERLSSSRKVVARALSGVIAACPKAAETSLKSGVIEQLPKRHCGASAAEGSIEGSVDWFSVKIVSFNGDSIKSFSVWEGGKVCSARTFSPW